MASSGLTRKWFWHEIIENCEAMNSYFSAPLSDGRTRSLWQQVFAR